MTIYLSDADVEAIERQANTTDIVGVIAAHVRQNLLQQPATGPEASRIGSTEPRTVHVPRVILQRLPNQPGALSGLLAELFSGWLQTEGGAA